MTLLQPIQDTITFNLSAEKTVVNDTVKVTATIVSMVTPDQTETKLKNEIRDMMGQFITPSKVTQWQFAGMQRERHASGYEQITLTATIRVPESENYSLDKRSRDVSKEGMQIVNVNVDTAPPASMIEDAENELRLMLLEKATVQLEAINKKLSAQYRIGNVGLGGASRSEFSNKFSNSTNNRMAIGATGASGPSGFAYGSGFDDENTLGNAVKLTMIATVTLSTIIVS